MKVILDMFYLFSSNANLQFGIKKLTWRFYTTAEALFTSKRVKLINKNKFVEVPLDKNLIIFVIHITVLGNPKLVMPKHFLRVP